MHCQKPPLAPPPPRESNISADPTSPQPRPFPPPPLSSAMDWPPWWLERRSITAACKSTSCFLHTPSCSFFQGGHVPCACVSVSLEAPACITLSTAQVSKWWGDTFQQGPAAPPDNFERILSSVKPLKLSMCPNSACCSCLLPSCASSGRGYTCSPAPSLFLAFVRFPLHVFPADSRGIASVIHPSLKKKDNFLLLSQHRKGRVGLVAEPLHLWN